MGVACQARELAKFSLALVEFVAADLGQMTSLRLVLVCVLVWTKLLVVSGQG